MDESDGVQKKSKTDSFGIWVLWNNSSGYRQTIRLGALGEADALGPRVA
jgi:hypothetical protein